MDNKTLEPLGETSIFENFKYFDKKHNEYWLARELQKILAYSEWRNFLNVIEKAITACENSGNDISDHFVDVNKTVHTGASSKDIEDIQLSRYACYLIVQNGDPRKKKSLWDKHTLLCKLTSRNYRKNFRNSVKIKNV